MLPNPAAPHWDHRAPAGAPGLFRSWPLLSWPPHLAASHPRCGPGPAGL